MEYSIVIQKLTDCIKDIFAFSISRLYNKQDAEDLTNDIIVEVLSSAGRLQNDDAFYGYMWAIADNTFKRYIRSKKREELEYHIDFPGVYWDTPEVKLLENEEIMILRRELTLLSKQYRDVTVRFYIENKSCSTIANELDISEEMVKYYLFKTRKMLKEGVTMERKYGEKSYNPGKFNIDFWGCGNNGYIWQTFARRLPGNIVLAAYEKPMSMEELSLELGVSVPYLEDELDILLKHNFVKRVGYKYQTDFLIFRTPYELEIQETISPAAICNDTATYISQVTEIILPKFRKMNLGIQLNDNQLRWFIVNYALINALGEFEERVTKRFGEYPMLNHTTQGFVFGHDNDYAYGYFTGIYGHCENQDHTAWYTAVNYNAIKKCQFWRGITVERSEILCNAILNQGVSIQNEEIVAQLIGEGMVRLEDGKLRAEFPTFTSKQGYLMRQELREMIDAIVTCMGEICKSASEIFKKHTPKHFHDRCERLCHIRHQADAMGIIVEKLVADGYLIVPDEQTNLCIFGVKRLSSERTNKAEST